MSLPFSLQDRHLTWNKMHPHLLTWIPPHTAVLPSNPPSHPSPLPKYTYPTVQVFLPPSPSAIPASHLQPAPLCQTTSETTSQAKTPPRPPFHPRTGPSVAERRRRPPRQQRIDERITMAIRLKRGRPRPRGRATALLRRGWSPTRHPPNTERVRAPLLFPAPDGECNSPNPAECQGWGRQPPLFSVLHVMMTVSMGRKAAFRFSFSFSILQACF